MMMNGLIELISGKPQSLVACIKNHLCLMFNTRQGSIIHMPFYGLPDVTTLYQQLPNAKNRFMCEIKFAIERYEPRIQYAKIIEQTDSQQQCILHLEIYAKIHRHDVVCFDTYFLSGGRVDM
jgi:type VI secretion system protein